MIPKEPAAGLDPGAGNRFSDKHALGLDPRDHAQANEGAGIMLGDILARLTDETTAIETILGTGDLSLLATVQERAATDGVDLGACVTQTVQRYTHEASDEEWITLMGLLNRSPDPGTACIKRAFEHAAREQS
jgi:hypothetical protein